MVRMSDARAVLLAVVFAMLVSAIAEGQLSPAAAGSAHPTKTALDEALSPDILPLDKITIYGLKGCGTAAPSVEDM